MIDTAEISYKDSRLHCGIAKSNIGFDHLDISNLASSLQLFSMDPGFKNSAAVDSSICYLDGEKGTLLYRGYPIEQVCDRLSYFQCADLLIKDQVVHERCHIDQWVFNSELLTDHIEAVKSLVAKKDHIETMHPMSVLMMVFSCFAGRFGKELNYKNDSVLIDDLIDLILILMPITVANVLRMCQGRSWRDFDYKWSKSIYSEIFLKIYHDHEPTEIEILSFETMLILHADHEQNASTFTLRSVGSSAVNIYACVSAALASLWGSSHGGANEACIDMLHSIGSIENIPDILAKAKDRDDPFRLMGFGHRVYRHYDPRALIIKKLYDPLLQSSSNDDDPLFALAQALEKEALNDEYFSSRKLFPNIDFYSGIIQMKLGIPRIGFTSIFALGRIAGWLAHWREMHQSPLLLIRPRQRYVGHRSRNLPDK